ncbi:hypothetical protein SS50377_23445 [Spironucleus salmonicida]|uniref:Uncharacterized protein n=1 Tax=Spironucleus salmonicida TaxID=348837 RepID=V6LNE6_9EUKA|nr:hypothetical protein SS50377_23445 [Spironucleus salmonicida]|eukprot:EST46182.1 Hypothetical protein SS50377_13777 [Spironucleus salmonicida]
MKRPHRTLNNNGTNQDYDPKQLQILTNELLTLNIQKKELQQQIQLIESSIKQKQNFNSSKLLALEQEYCDLQLAQRTAKTQMQDAMKTFNLLIKEEECFNQQRNAENSNTLLLKSCETLKNEISELEIKFELEQKLKNTNFDDFVNKKTRILQDFQSQNSILDNKITRALVQKKQLEDKTAQCVKQNDEIIIQTQKVQIELKLVQKNYNDAKNVLQEIQDQHLGEKILNLENQMRLQLQLIQKYELLQVNDLTKILNQCDNLKIQSQYYQKQFEQVFDTFDMKNLQNIFQSFIQYKEQQKLKLEDHQFLYNKNCSQTDYLNEQTFQCRQKLQELQIEVDNQLILLKQITMEQKTIDKQLFIKEQQLDELSLESLQFQLQELEIQNQKMDDIVNAKLK